MEALCFYQTEFDTSNCKFISIPDEYADSTLTEIKNYVLDKILLSLSANGTTYSKEDITYLSLEFKFGEYVSQALQSNIKCPMCNKRNTTPVANNGGYVCNDCGTKFFVEKHITQKGTL